MPLELRWLTRIPKSHEGPSKQLLRDIQHAICRKWSIKMFLFILLCTTVCNMYGYGYKKTVENVKTMKYILMWTADDTYPFSTWKIGQQSFIENRCPVSNCFFVSHRNLSMDLKKFDAVAFNGRNLDLKTGNFVMPLRRYDHQRYIYFNTESSDNYPICHPIYDCFFNWTATYKLDSDVVYSYISIKDGAGNVIGPRLDMKWLHPMTDVYVASGKKRKTKAVAWFVSNCFTRNGREIYANELKWALKKFKLNIDVYGACGSLKCISSNRNAKCNEMLNDYYFYLAFENSFSEDYVTEKVLAPHQNNNVPIVFGGANYSRFLPPGSYIDARDHTPMELAAIIAYLIANPDMYNQFFRWRAHYSFFTPDTVCSLCTALNNDTLTEKRQVYHHLRSWWNPDYERRCEEEKL